MPIVGLAHNTVNGRGVAACGPAGGRSDLQPRRVRRARELAGQIGKTGRNGNRAPFDVLADFVRLGLASDLAIWREWESASKGRHALTCSKRPRKQLLVDIERTDEDIAADNDGDQVDVALLHWVTWREIVARRLEAELLEAVERVTIEDSYQATVAFLSAHGLGAPLRPPPRE